MMIPVSLLICTLLMTTSAFGQVTDDSLYQVPAPEGWGKETIQLPPEFAPDMAWHGTEELRFAPKWLKAESETFFSYALLFRLPDNQKLDAKTLESELLTYYRGLSKAVSESKEVEVDLKPFTMTVKADSTKTARRAGGEDITAFAGELSWIEPFTTGKLQTLHMDIQVWHSVKYKGSCVFICASPLPQTAEVWKSLREIREGCVLIEATQPGTETKP